MRSVPVRIFWQTASVLTTSARLLRLASLLSARPWWSAAELASRLEVTERTIRRDVDRLRALDHPIESVPGPGGGYRLGSGGEPVPLQLDADEAVAIAVCLRVAAGAGVSGIEAAAPRALAKLERTLPPRARARVTTLAAATEPFGSSAAPVDPNVLLVIAEACRAGEQVRCTYTRGDGTSSRRTLEPHRLVPAVGRWYLVARDVDRVAQARSAGGDPPDDGWRTLRVDRITRPGPTAQRVTYTDPPDARRAVSEALGVGPYRYRARIRFHATHDEVASRVPASVGVLEAEGDDACVFTIGADELGWLVGRLAAMELPWTVLEPDELRDAVRDAAARLAAASQPV
jgi:predicted DNA-binding transcriptional regulator YafY